MLRKNFFDTEQVATIVKDYRNAGLPPDEVAVMAFTEKVTLQANGITEEDIHTLRSHGLSDTEILDIVLAASARNFFSRVLDAVGAEPDKVYLELEPDLRKVLAKGRPFCEGTRD